MSSPDLKSIISQLTLEEKVTLLAGRDFWVIEGIPRLNVPPIKFSDGPNGARGGLFFGGVKAACFPAGVCLASTWDRSWATEIGKALAEETKTKGASVILGPTVCPHRDPKGGRNFESYSEDPLLAGEIAVEYIRGVQKEGISATIKHFAANESETRRFFIDARVGERALREIYLKPFEIAIKKADPWAMMTSYNQVNGFHADMNKHLLTDILRNQWGYKGLVMSDWGGTNSTVESLNAGLNLEMPGPAIHRNLEKIKKAIENGTVTDETLNSLIEYHLNLLVRTDRFSHPEIPEEKAVDRPEHRRLIRQVGAEGAVLLKNENNTLPIQIDKIKSVALVGLAKTYFGSGGGSASVNSHHKITAHQALEEAIGDKVELKYAEGVRILRNLPALSTDCYDEEGKPGFTARLYQTEDITTPDSTKNLAGAAYDVFTSGKAKSITLTSTFKPTVAGNHYISFATIGNASVQINGETLFNVEGAGCDVMAFLLGVGAEQQKRYLFEVGKEYQIRVEAKIFNDGKMGESLFAGGAMGFNLGFVEEIVFEEDLLAPAVEAAKSSDLAIVFTGHTTVWETEGCDRDSMDLPKQGSQDQLIKAVVEANPNTIVVNCTGSPITMPWLQDVKAVVQSWFPGQEAGYAIADVLLGAVNPSGRLPVTFPKSEKVCPAYANFPGDIENDVVEYEEGIYIGYRHYDNHPEDVLFPFGYGLSYTTFDVSNIALSGSNLSPETSLTVTAEVANTGSVDGGEVVQVYVGAPSSSAMDKPKKVLVGFAKAKLSPGEKKSVEIEFTKESIASWSEHEDRWVVDEGEYTVFVGTSSTVIKGTKTFKIDKSFHLDP